MKKIIVGMFGIIVAAILLGGFIGKTMYKQYSTKSIEENSEKDKNNIDKIEEENKNKEQAEKENLKNKENKNNNLSNENLNKEEKSLQNINETSLNTKDNDWYFMSKKDGSIPRAPEEALPYLKKYSAYYTGNTDKKIIYLTIDEGYENGYTSKILDILKKNNVKATFFVTKSYITSNKELVNRMVNEGHIIGNHSVSHLSMAQVALKGQSTFKEEFTGVENEFKRVTGKNMEKFFRPPMGKYSEKSLYYTKQLGYKTIFWSFAYGDYDTNKQPERNYAKNHIINSSHNGAIYLLHAISKTNLEIMDEIIKELKNKGYEFGTLKEL